MKLSTVMMIAAVCVLALAVRFGLVTWQSAALIGFAGMLLSQASAATSTSVLRSASAANTAAATSGSGMWLDVRAYEGELLCTLDVGAVTGTLTGAKMQSASDANGTGAADITGAGFGATVANTTYKVAVDPKAVVGGFIGFAATIATGPSLLSCVVSGKKQVV